MLDEIGDEIQHEIRLALNTPCPFPTFHFFAAAHQISAADRVASAPDAVSRTNARQLMRGSPFRTLDSTRCPGSLKSMQCDAFRGVKRLVYARRGLSVSQLHTSLIFFTGRQVEEVVPLQVNLEHGVRLELTSDESL